MQLSRRWLPFACLSCALLQPAAAAGPALSAQQLRADLDFVLTKLAETHPDPAFSADMAAVARLAEELRQDAAPAHSRDEVWRRLTRFNPLFADAHLMIAEPGWRDAAAAHLAAGRGLFPFEVGFDRRGRLQVAAALGGGPSEHAGARIVGIDGMPAERAVAALLARAGGDTPAFRRHLLAQRWWYFHWRMYGAAAQYRLTLERAGRRWSLDLPAGTAQPAVLRDENDLDGMFRADVRPGCPAVLTVGSFLDIYKPRLLALSAEAFARMRAAGSDTLVIDVSANGGGDDPMWLEGLMPYLAKQRYRTGSAWIKRVMKADPAKNEQVGQVVRGEIETWYAPQPDHPLAFTGKVFVRIGPGTYSSAVLFANVMRDFGIATLSGAGGFARKAQSGGVRQYLLPHSGLVMYVPRFVLQAPLPDAPAALLTSQGAEPALCPAAP